MVERRDEGGGERGKRVARRDGGGRGGGILFGWGLRATCGPAGFICFLLVLFFWWGGRKNEVPLNERDDDAARRSIQDYLR